MFFRARFVLLLFLPLISATAASAPVAAQDPIRVESNQVLVPVVISDKRLFARLGKSKTGPSAQKLLAEYSQLLDGVTLGDFQLFEDGKKQTIQSVALQHATFSLVHDNLGKHPEIIGTGGGRWAYPDRPESDPHTWLPFPQYVIAYVPPASPEGSCHRIQVKVDHPNLAVYSRDEYCNIMHSPSDPLQGTDFGKQMEDDLASTKESKIDLAMQAVAFYKDTGDAGVYIELQFPWQSLKYEFRQRILYATIGTLGMIYKKDGTFAARFSDFACCYNDKASKPPAKTQTLRDIPGQDSSMIPNRYETQIHLLPGEYDIRVVLSDGEKFGRAEMPLTVRTNDGKQLTVGPMFLSRRIRNASAGSPGSPAQPPEPSFPFLSKGVALTPTTTSLFKKDESFYVFFEVYDPQLPGHAAATLQVHMKILDTKTGREIIDFDPVDAAPYIRPDSPRISIARGIKLTNLADGSYRLEVQATDSTGETTAWSGENFTVEAFGLPRWGPDDLLSKPL